MYVVCEKKRSLVHPNEEMKWWGSVFMLISSLQWRQLYVTNKPCQCIIVLTSQHPFLAIHKAYHVFMPISILIHSLIRSFICIFFIQLFAGIHYVSHFHHFSLVCIIHPIITPTFIISVLFTVNRLLEANRQPYYCLAPCSVHVKQDSQW